MQFVKNFVKSADKDVYIYVHFEGAFFFLKNATILTMNRLAEIACTICGRLGADKYLTNTSTTPLSRKHSKTHRQKEPDFGALLQLVYTSNFTIHNRTSTNCRKTYTSSKLLVIRDRSKSEF